MRPHLARHRIVSSREDIQDEQRRESSAARTNLPVSTNSFSPDYLGGSRTRSNEPYSEGIYVPGGWEGRQLNSDLVHQVEQDFGNSAPSYRRGSYRRGESSRISSNMKTSDDKSMSSGTSGDITCPKHTKANHSLNALPSNATVLPIRHGPISRTSNVPTSNAPKRILIAVFGMTGTGKTTLIKKIAGNAARQLVTGHGLESCTQNIETIDCRIGDCDVTLVDTPGFDDSKRSDTEILSLIAGWLQNAYKKDTLLSGIIYLHRISDIRMSGSSIKNLRMFRKLCGSENMSKVTLVTTMWDKVTPEEGTMREKGLSQPGGFWEMMVTSGSQIKRHDGSQECAQQLIIDMFDNKPTTIKIQDEIASGKALIDTDAGASINEEILRLQIEHKENLEAVKEEMALAMKQGNKVLQAQLQEEHNRVIKTLKQQADQQFELAQARASKLESDLQEASAARRRLEANFNAQREEARRDLSEAAAARRRLEDGLNAQRESSRKQEERSLQLEKDVKTMASDKKRLEAEVASQKAERFMGSLKPEPVVRGGYHSGSKTLDCVCGNRYKVYGPGQNQCPYCKRRYNNSEADWNTFAWDMY